MNRSTTKRAPADPISGDIRCGQRPPNFPNLMPIHCFHPRAGDEVDFDINNPPLEPVTPPGNAFLGSIETNLTANDVVMGRGKNTNLRAGNCLFRSLVADFRPLYLMLRQSDKPKIARTIVLIVRQRGGRFLGRAGEDGNNGRYLYEVGDKRAKKKTAQALRESWAIRSKTRALKGRVIFQGKVDGDDRMVAEHQEPPDEGGLIVGGGGEEMMRTSTSTNPQSMQALRDGLDFSCKKYYQSEGLCNGWPSPLTEKKEGTPLVTVPLGFKSSLLQRSWNNTFSPVANHPPSLTHNVLRLIDAPPNPFVFGQGPPSAVCHPSALSYNLSYSGLMQRYHYSNYGCYRPMHCNTGVPPNYDHDSKRIQAHPQIPPTVLNDTLLSSSVADQPDHSDCSHQGRLSMHSFDDRDSFDDGSDSQLSLIPDVNLTDTFDTPL